MNNYTSKNNNKVTGTKGEVYAREFLEKQGYKILDTNVHFSRNCEIDIIALDGNALVFVEVKTRNTEFCGSGFEAITPKKYQNIKTGLFMYLQEHPQYKKFRIDGISIILKPALKIEHLKNI